jgi:hypothetical protein
MLWKRKLLQAPPDYITSNVNQYMTDGMAVTSLSASLLQKMSTAMDCPCQITIKWKLWCKFKKCKNVKLHKRRPAYILMYVTFDEYFANIQQVSKLTDIYRTTWFMLSAPHPHPFNFQSKKVSKTYMSVTQPVLIWTSQN